MLGSDTKINFSHRSLEGDRNIMLFDLAVGGHHPEYIQHLADYWEKEALSGNLYIVVSPKFFEEHNDVINSVLNYYPSQIKFISITQDEDWDFRKQSNYLIRTFKQWQIFCKYSIELRISHCLIMYFDNWQFLLTLGVNSPCPFSTIYFRPAFHYHEFVNHVTSWKEVIRQWRQKLLLFRILQNPNLRFLFCLDPFAVKHIAQLSNRVRIIHLPDPVRSIDSDCYKVEQLKTRVGIDRERRVFLLFGSLNSRKGVYQLLEAIQMLPSSLCKRLCLLLAGSVSHSDKSQIEKLIAEISQVLPIQIIIRDEFIPQSEVQLYFQAADVILAPYQRHVGMSGILMQAAAVQKPVLASDYGLMGEITRWYELGLTVDSTKPQAIVQGLTHFLLESPDCFCNFTKMRQLAEQNTAERFSTTIFNHIYYE
jgi:glycosyltransferase involved in cell wall biosynthesis